MPVYATSTNEDQDERHITFSITTATALNPANPQCDTEHIEISEDRATTYPPPPSEQDLQAAVAFLNRYNTVLLVKEGIADATTINTQNVTAIKSNAQQGNYITPDDATVSALNADGTYELWHQRLNHSSPEVMYETQKRVVGIPKLKRVDDLEKCDSCIKAKISKQPRGPNILTEPEHACQHIHADFGFIAIPKIPREQDTKPVCNTKTTPSLPINTRKNVPQNPRIKVQTFGIEISEQDLKKYTLAEGIHGYKAYLNIVDRKSRYMWLFLSKDKEPPLQFLELWFKQHGIGTRGISGCILRTDGGGELAGSHELRKLCDKYHYLVETTGTDASSQNGLSERPHRHAGEIVRALLDNANLPYAYWPYALIHWALI
jgi:hypothetical protein